VRKIENTGEDRQEILRRIKSPGGKRSYREREVERTSAHDQRRYTSGEHRRNVPAENLSGEKAVKEQLPSCADRGERREEASRGQRESLLQKEENIVLTAGGVKHTAYL